MKFLLEHKKRRVVAGIILVSLLGLYLIIFSDKIDEQKMRGYLFNYNDQKIQIIEKTKNEEIHHMIGFWDDTSNEFQYAFNEYDTIFTSGNSYSNQFSILEVQPSDITTHLRLGSEKEAIFPLTKDRAGNLYFSVTSYADNGDETRSVSRYNRQENQLVDLGIELVGMMDGCIIGSILYLTAYNEKNDNYDLYQVSLESTNQLSLVEESVGAYNVYNVNHELYLKTRQNKLKAYQSDMEYPAGEQTIIYQDYLINLTSSEEETQDLSVYSTSQNNVIYKKKSVIGFYIEKDKLRVYTKDTVSTFSFEK